MVVLSSHHHLQNLPSSPRHSVPVTLTPLSSPGPGPAILLPVSLDVMTLETSREWNHTGFTLLCLAYFTELNVPKVHPCL